LADEVEKENEVEGDWVATHIDYVPSADGKTDKSGAAGIPFDIEEIDEIEEEIGEVKPKEAAKSEEVKKVEEAPKPVEVPKPAPKVEEDEDDDDDDDDVDDIGEIMSSASVKKIEAEDSANFKEVKAKEEIKEKKEEKGKEKAKNENIVESRTYDVSITYDKYYQTPRIWLFGYDPDGTPLNPNKILEDIHADYTHKTVTIDQHPNLNSQWAGVHPCRHSEMMKRMMDRMAENGKVVKVDLYLYLFLKFISAVIPTIEYDFTTTFAMWAKNHWIEIFQFGNNWEISILSNIQMLQTIEKNIFWKNELKKTNRVILIIFLG